MTDFANIRKQFALAKGYLDSASTSLTPTVVIDEMTRYYKEYRANVHRGLYKESECATREYELARKRVAAFIGAEPDEIIFTAGATHGANMLYRMIEESGFADKGNIVTTTLEHHANIVPIQQLAKRKHLDIRVAKLEDISIKSVDVLALVDSETVIVGITLASNVTGAIISISEIAKAKHDALLVCDATAAIGHIPVDVKALGADVLYFSGHKMMGPTGVGVLWMKKTIMEKLEPSMFGGHMVSKVTTTSATWAEGPAKFEAGTLNIAGVIGLGKAVEYLEMLNVSDIHTHIRGLTETALLKLRAIPEVTIFAAEPDVNAGNIAFTIEGIHPHDVAEIMARHNVKVRAGHHCAMPLHEALGVAGTVRASFHLYNSTEDIDMLIAAIHDVITIFKK